MPRLSNEQLIELCATPYERLSPAQQRSARSYKRKAMDDESLTQEAERLLEDQPQLSVTQAYYSVMQLNKPKAAPKPSSPAESPETETGRIEEDLPRTVDGLLILTDWPEDIETVHLRPPSKWDRPAAALQSGGIGVIARGMTRRQAMSLRRRIRAGEIIAFRPKGDWRVEIAPGSRAGGQVAGARPIPGTVIVVDLEDMKRLCDELHDALDELDDDTNVPDDPVDDMACDEPELPLRLILDECRSLLAVAHKTVLKVEELGVEYQIPGLPERSNAIAGSLLDAIGLVNDAAGREPDR